MMLPNFFPLSQEQTDSNETCVVSKLLHKQVLFILSHKVPTLCSKDCFMILAVCAIKPYKELNQGEAYKLSEQGL